jgi:uncharacterized SAM-binding protein YcdF (DUF218 family)
MYVAYKLAQLLLRPELWILACMSGAWILSRSPNRLPWVRGLLLCAILLFYGLGLRPVKDALTKPLEVQPSPVDFRHHHDALVLLTGNTDRLICGVSLLRNGVAGTLIISGGSGSILQNQPPESLAMRDLAVRLGTPPESIRIEANSRTTAESAVAVRQMFPEARRIVLVTSILHLPRAVGVFRKQGFEVIPTSCAEPASTAWDLPDFLPSGSILTATYEVIHEYVGILVYRAAGKL